MKEYTPLDWGLDSDLTESYSLRREGEALVGERVVVAVSAGYAGMPDVTSMQRVLFIPSAQDVPTDLVTLVPLIGGIPWSITARGVAHGRSVVDLVIANAGAAATATAAACAEMIEHLPDAYAEYARQRGADVAELDDDVLLQ